MQKDKTMQNDTFRRVDECVQGLMLLSRGAPNDSANILMNDGFLSEDSTAVMRELAWMIQRGVDTVDDTFVTRIVACAWRAKKFVECEEYNRRMMRVIELEDVAGCTLVRAVLG